jgi:hypothetical protein
VRPHSGTWLWERLGFSPKRSGGSCRGVIRSKGRNEEPKVEGGGVGWSAFVSARSAYHAPQRQAQTRAISRSFGLFVNRELSVPVRN